MLSQPVQLHDIRDAEAFVISCLNRSGIRFPPDEKEDLIAEGLALLCALSARFDPHREGYAQAGRFSGYAARYLPRKLTDAWHRRHPEHVVRTSPEDGSRSWDYMPAPLSLHHLTTGPGEDGDREDTLAELAVEDPDNILLHLAVTATVAIPSSPVIAALSRNLTSALQAEHQLTLRVAVLRGMDMHRSEITTHLGASDIEVRMALERLKKVGQGLNGNGAPAAHETSPAP